MDDQRFDELARMATATSRRHALRALGGGAIGSLLGALGVRQATAQEGGIDCCPPDKPRLCDDRCVDLLADPANCGACGITCRGSEICVDGACVKQQACRGRMTDCGDGCVDLRTDPNNCGACGATCASGICDQGACAPMGDCQPKRTQQCGSDVGACQQGVQTCQDDGTWGPCEGSVGPQEEICNGLDDDCNGTVDDVDPALLATDPQNCGACGHACASGQICEGGVCVGGLR